MREATTFRRILVAVDDRSRADQLAAAASGLAAADDAVVLLVHVSDINVCCGAMDHSALHEHERDLLGSLVESLPSRGVRARTEQRCTGMGRVAEHLLDAAAEFRADLLIIDAGRPARLRGRAKSRTMGRLVRQAPCPVLILPPGPPETSGPLLESTWLRLVRRRSGSPRAGVGSG